MIKFFRNARRENLATYRFVQYLTYALGEIILVVIGILIALSIDNWHGNKKDKELEKQYVSGIMNDLQSDSVVISVMRLASDKQVRNKQKLIEYFDGKTFSNDSVSAFFAVQWGMAVGFNPITTTLDEMKSTGRIGVIRNPNLRKQIISTYNKYQIFIHGNQAYYERNRAELRKIAFKIPRVFDFESFRNASKPDIIAALKDNELRNFIMANYAISVNKDLTSLQNENHQLLEQINRYFSEL